jgi:ribosomal protein S28E/S33
VGSFRSIRVDVWTKRDKDKRGLEVEGRVREGDIGEGQEGAREAGWYCYVSKKKRE